MDDYQRYDEWNERREVLCLETDRKTYNRLADLVWQAEQMGLNVAKILTDALRLELNEL